MEEKYNTRFDSISSFRLSPKVFPVGKALQEYHLEPIAYALALAELNREVFKATRKRCSGAVVTFMRDLAFKRRSRDVLGDNDNSSDEADHGMTLLQIFRYLETEISKILNLNFAIRLPKGLDFETPIAREDAEELSRWGDQLRNFVKNVNFFCQHTGSEVEELAVPIETINNLRKFASDRGQELAPLLEVNARLNKELTSYKRINAALQTRHTIEKLTFELPYTAQYDLTGSGPKWQVLWNQIWEDASRNEKNPFHDLWNQSKGEYARNNIRDKGRNLFADMSGEIHGYDQRPNNTLDYEHFDASARKVAKILHDNPIVDQRTGDVDWTQEIRKYPIAWPAADNLALTLLQRLEGRVASLRRRLKVAEEERDREIEHQAEIQAEVQAGGTVHQKRETDREANDIAQDVVMSLNACFGAGY